MGMIANYQYLSNKDLTALKSFDKEKGDIFETVEEWNEDSKIPVDIDKMRDALHFVLTGVDSSDPIENDPLSEAVVGVFSIDNIEKFIAYTENSRIKDIVFALDNFDIANAMEKFSMKKCKKAKLYPNIWDCEEDADDIKKELTGYFQNLKEFFE